MNSLRLIPCHDLAYPITKKSDTQPIWLPIEMTARDFEHRVVGQQMPPPKILEKFVKNPAKKLLATVCGYHAVAPKQDWSNLCIVNSALWCILQQTDNDQLRHLLCAVSFFVRINSLLNQGVRAQCCRCRSRAGYLPVQSTSVKIVRCVVVASVSILFALCIVTRSCCLVCFIRVTCRLFQCFAIVSSFSSSLFSSIARFC